MQCIPLVTGEIVVASSVEDIEGMSRVGAFPPPLDRPLLIHTFYYGRCILNVWRLHEIHIRVSRSNIWPVSKSVL